MEDNVVTSYSYRLKHFIGCYTGDLQRNVVVLVCLVTYNRVMTKRKCRKNSGR